MSTTVHYTRPQHRQGAVFLEAKDFVDTTDGKINSTLGVKSFFMRLYCQIILLLVDLPTCRKKASSKQDRARRQLGLPRLEVSIYTTAVTAVIRKHDAQ